MPKVDDTLAVPEVITAPWVKRFFKNRLGIPVHVHNANGMNPSPNDRLSDRYRNEWCGVWIPSDRGNLHKLSYSHHFPPELGNRCVRLTYPESEELCKQNFAGNVEGHSISMFGWQRWRKLFQDLIDNPIRPDAVQLVENGGTAFLVIDRKPAAD